MISNFANIHLSGDMQSIAAAIGGTGGAVPDPDTDAGPAMLYQAFGVPDPRFIYLKDKVGGYTGVVPMTHASGYFELTNQIPAAASTTNLAALQNVVSGTAMTLTTAQATGISPGIPFIPLAGQANALNSGTAVSAIALDFGFAFGNVTSGSRTITVADSTQFTVGMPLVIGGVGNSGGTTALLTNVASLASATTITVQDAPAATNATAPIGTGNYWGPSENGFPTPTAALPYVAKGPGLFLDARQSIARCIEITGAAGSVGGNFLISGYDLYGMAMSQLLTVGAAASAFTTKTFKYITSIVPQFTDAHNYSVGTGDEFGFNLRVNQIENTIIWWNGLLNAASTGFTAAVGTTPATTTTGDVRGTILTSTLGNGSGIGSTVSNGTIVSLAMSGVRLAILVAFRPSQITRATQADPTPIYGVLQA